MTATYGGGLFPQHVELLAGSCITPAHATARGYVSVDTKVRLGGVGITPSGRRTPGLLVPMLRADGSTWGWQYRPDSPRLRTGKAVKYETPTGQRNGIDVPPGVGPLLGDPAVPLLVTEGTRKADAAAVLGLACIALPGVWSWRGKNAAGGAVAVADWHDVALNGRRVVLAFDSDVVVKPAVRRALTALAEYLTSKGAAVEYLHLPHEDGKAGLDDWIAAGGTVGALWALVRPDAPLAGEPDDRVPAEDRSPADTVIVPALPPVEPMDLADARDVFTRWLGEHYDLDALHFALALAAVEQLDGDAPWGLIVSGSGNAKTETVSAATGAGATVTSSISSEGALLSATSRQERSKDATGGLLRKVGTHGVLVIKDVTTILSMNSDTRLSVLGALREVADGFWERNVGTDGGRSLTWRGRIVVIGAVTTAWDAHHSVIASMGDRFLLLRVDSTLMPGRLASGRQSLANIGHEDVMREDLRSAFGGVIAGMDRAGIDLADAEADVLLGLANIVTAARTGVEHDRKGDVLYAHAFEAPTRLVKYLGQLVRGGVAVGMDRADALRLAVRVAHDCVPPLRLAALATVTAHPGNSTSEVARLMDKPRTSVDRALQELHLLDLLTVTSDPADTRWRYRVADAVDGEALAVLIAGAKALPGNTTTRALRHTEGKSAESPTEPHVPPSLCTSTDFSGETSELPASPCPHGIPAGNRPDPWLAGRLACPECALTIREDVA